MILERDSFEQMFVHETYDLTEQLEAIIILNEGSGGIDSEGVNAVFRIMHTIKGSASMMSIFEISKLAHGMEDLFEYFRKEGKIVTNNDAIELLLESVDFIREEASKLESGRVLDGNAEVLVNKAKTLLQDLKSGSQTPKPVETPKAQVIQSDMNFHMKVFFDKEAGMESLRAFMLIKDLEEMAFNITHLPEDISEEEAEQEIRSSGFTVFFNSESPENDILKKFQNDPLIAEITLNQDDNQVGHQPQTLPNMVDKPEQHNELENDQLLEDDQQLEEVNKAFEDKFNKAKVSIIKSTSSGMVNVTVEKLNSLMDLVGELVLSGMMISQELLSGTLDQEIIDKRELLIHHHKKTITDVQDVAMALRMVPVAPTFQRMRRVVRDMAKKIGNEINFHTIGMDIEIDRNVLEGITEPLLHLIRNAVDHGIGKTHQRIAEGKSDTGNITLEARNMGNEVWLGVTDDGVGLNPDDIYIKAVETGITDAKREELSDSEILSYIFRAGFSTKAITTEYSGRGVGLDVVKSNVTKVGGSVAVESEIGVGTSFIIKLPVTLAIIGGLAFTVGQNKYSIPVNQVMECIKVTEGDLMQDLNGNEAVVLEDVCYPILRLHKRFKVKNAIENIEDGVMMVVNAEGTKYCIFVDKLLGEQELVVKPLPKWVERKAKGLSGCSLLPDGSISLIIKPSTLITG